MDHLAELLGDSPAITALRAEVRRLLQRRVGPGRMPPVLIQGETGTGKGLLARMLHRAGPRADAAFVDVNCAAIPATLLEAEMFGYERGAFTDARQSKPGLFQTAHRGTIFLDEVALLPEPLQAKLLKVLEEKAVRRLGATRTENLDVWILAATNEDLADAMEKRRFRADLYHRLAVLTLSLPPLRSRGEDVIHLAEHFLARSCLDYGLPPKSFGPEARQTLLAHSWPGNVRELSNVVERAALLSESPVLTGEALDLPGRPPPASEASAVPRPKPPGSLDDTVRVRLVETLTETGWNISRTAAVLGISRNTVHAHIEKYGLRSGTAAPPRRAAPRATPRSAPDRPRPDAPHVPLQWEVRRLALLRTRILGPAETDIPVMPALTLINEKIKTFGGRIDGISPTGVYALFGMDPAEETTMLAVHAAMALHKAAERARREEGAPWSLKSSVHAAHLHIGVTGSALDVDADGKRDAWNAMEQMLESAQPGDITVTPAAAALLRRRLELVPVQAGPPAFRVVGLHRPDSSPTYRGRFVGRQQEMATLRALFDAADRGHGQAVAIAGDAGIGKSRLLLELRRSFTGERTPSIAGHCFSFSTTVPYAPILEIIRAACGISELDSPATTTDKLRLALEAVRMSAEDSTPPLLRLLAIDDEPESTAPGGPEALRAQIFQTMRQLLLRKSERDGLVVVVEDLHWTDHVSEMFLSSLVDTLVRSRILLITTCRTGYRPPWLHRSNATQIALQPLSPEDSRVVVAKLLEHARAPEDVTRLILARAEGNPLFLEELSRAVLERGGASAPSGVTDTIQDVLSARLDRLSAAPRRILTTAAVIGKDVPLGLLREVTGTPEPALLEALVHLQKAEFLHEGGFGPEPEYTFKHGLTRDVAYDSLRPAARRAIHARTVECLEALPDRAPQVERLAYHAVQAEDWTRAVTYLRQAGAKAFARSANREALGYLRQALAALEQLPETRERLEEGIDLRLELRGALFLLGELGAVGSYLDDAVRLAQRLGDPLRLGRVWTYMTHYHWITGRSREARGFAEQALRIANQSGEPLLRLTAQLYVGLACQTWSEYREAERLLHGNLALLRGTHGLERLGQVAFPAVMTRAYLVHCLGDVGRFAEGIALGEEAIALAKSLEHAYSLGLACWPLAYLYCVRGDVATALGLLHRCATVQDLDRQARGTPADDPVEAARRSTFVLSAPRLLWLLGHCYVRSGRIEHGLGLLEEAAAAFAATGMRVYDALVTVHLGEGYLAAGRLTDARAAGERALALADQRQQRGAGAYARRLLGEIGSDPRALDAVAAREHFRIALDEASAIEMRPLQARCRLGLGTLECHLGEPAGPDNVSRATTMLEEMEMRGFSA